MEAEELRNYLSRKVLIGLSNGQKYRGFLVRINENEVILENAQYEKEIVLPINSIISIRVSINYFEKFKSYRKFF